MTPFADPDTFAAARCLDDDRWTSDDPAVRAVVAPLCADCPALAACRAWQAVARPRTGVWAGVDLEARKPRKARPQAPASPGSTRRRADPDGECTGCQRTRPLAGGLCTGCRSRRARARRREREAA